MANDTVIDELSLQIDANASAAIKNLSQMQRQLRNLAKDIGRVSSTTSSLTRLTSAFVDIGKINTGNIKLAIDQLERLDKINLKNLDGKKINLDIKFNGADEAERRVYAIQDAIKSTDIKGMAKDFSSTLGIVGNDAKKVEKAFTEAFDIISKKGEGANAPFFNLISNINKSKFQLDRTMYDKSAQEAREAYLDLWNFIKNTKIKIPMDVTDIEQFRLSIKASKGEMAALFSSKTGTGIDKLLGDWEHLGDLTESTKSFSGFTQPLINLENDKDQIRELMSLLHRLREYTSTPITLANVDEERANGFFSDLVQMAGDAPKEIEKIFNAEINKHMRESAFKIPLDVKIDESRIENQIASSVKRASSKEYELPVKFAVDTKQIKSTVATALGQIDISKMNGMTESLKGASSAIAEIGTVNPKESGLTSFINSINRLTTTDLSKFNLDIFKDIREAIRDFASMEDISASVNRFVSSLARLANAGDKTSTVATTLPKLGSAIRSVMGGLSSMGGLPAELNAFVTSIASLANAGNKTGTTAEHLVTLGENLKTFITDVSQAPEVSNNILQMTTAIAELANAGGKTGTAARTINKGIGSVADDSGKANDRLKILTAIMDDLGKVFQKSAGFIKQGASHIVNSLKQLKSAGNGLGGATQSIKNMIAAMIGFRGVQGLVTLSKQVIDLGANMTEIDHIVESVFGDMAGVVETWSKNAITNFGIAEHSAKQYAGTLSAMFQASGIGYKNAGLMGIKLTELAGDLSAFYNIDTQTAFKKIQSGMAGMVRPLRDLGIDLTAATLSEYALSQGIQKSYSDMTQAEKVMLRYKYLLEVTTTQSGDFARTSGRYRAA